MSTTLTRAKAASAAWSDARLVKGCLRGSEEAWSALIEKYKNLIYSIPIKYGLSADDAADIFQSVCVDMLAQLETLRESRALPKWLMQIASHKSYHWKRLQCRLVPLEDEESSPTETLPKETEELLWEAEREQLLREAISTLPPRCADLVKMLFLTQPAIPYAEVARRLGIATGSIGFIRGRCLTKLRKQLETSGLA